MRFPRKQLTGIMRKLVHRKEDVNITIVGECFLVEGGGNRLLIVPVGADIDMPLLESLSQEPVVLKKLSAILYRVEIR